MINWRKEENLSWPTHSSPPTRPCSILLNSPKPRQVDIYEFIRRVEGFWCSRRKTHRVGPLIRHCPSCPPSASDRLFSSLKPLYSQFHRPLIASMSTSRLVYVVTGGAPSLTSSTSDILLRLAPVHCRLTPRRLISDFSIISFFSFVC